MRKKAKDKFLNKTIAIRDRLAERIDSLAAEEPSPEDIKQIKELTTVVRELDKMVRENREQEVSQEAACSSFLESILQGTINEN